MPRTRNPYSPEFRAQIVELARSGRSVAELAREFEPSDQTIYNWIKQAERDEGKRADILSSSERDELRRLLKESKKLKQEREILAKAAAWFAKETDAASQRTFEFIDAHQAQYPIATMCRVLKVSASGYYKWRVRLPCRREQKDAMLTKEIQSIYKESDGTYGAPRIHVELRERGVHLGRKRVARLMRLSNLRGVSRRRGPRTTIRRPGAGSPPDLVNRSFNADKPDQLWVADITFVPTGSGFLYLAVVMDAFSRRIVGWSMRGHLRAELVLAALDMALLQRKPEGVIHHSDQGSQYTSLAFGKRCKEAGVRPSTGSVGDCYDSALCESFFATLECELIDRRRFETKAEARMAIFCFIEEWYNHRRRLSGICYQSPAIFEKTY